MPSPSTSTPSPRHTLLWGRPRDQRRHWRTFVGSYVLAMLALFALFLLFDRVLDPLVGAQIGDALYSPVLPVALFYSPPLVSAASAYRHGGVLTSVVVGVAPSLVFGAVVVLDVLVRLLLSGEFVSRGDAPLWGLMLVFGLIGIVGSFAGFLAGTVGRVVVGRVRTR